MKEEHLPIYGVGPFYGVGIILMTVIGIVGVSMGLLEIPVIQELC